MSEMKLRLGAKALHPKVRRGAITVAEENTPKISPNTFFDTTGDITIGEFVEISSGVQVITHKHHWNHSRGLRKEIQTVEAVDLEIGKDAFIGIDALLIGVREIGEGAVIGARAVVTNDVPAFEVWAGNPARKMGERRDA